MFGLPYLMDSPYMSNIAVQLMVEAEDPPEPVETAAALFNDRNPMHRLEEMLDSAHMIAHMNWGIYFTSNDFWNFEIPFLHDLVDEDDSYASYDTGIETQDYMPDLDNEAPGVSYSSEHTTETEAESASIEAGDDLEELYPPELEFDLKSGIEIAELVYRLLYKA